MMQTALNYYALSYKSSLFSHSVCPYDVFIKIGDQHYVRIFNKDASLEANRIESYLQKGISHFYLLKSDADAYFQSLIENLNNKDTELTNALPIATEALENSLINLYDSATISNQDVARVSQLSEFFALAIERERNILNSLELAFHNSSYGVRHSIDVALVSLKIFLNLPKVLQQDITIKEVIQAGLLHDVAVAGLLPEPYDYAASRMIQAKGWLLAHSVMAAHAFEYVSSISKNVQLAIEQHHEFIDGSGGPYAIEGDQLSVLGKVLALAEDFQVRLEGHTGAMFEHNKKAIMDIEKQKMKFDPQIVDALKKLS